MPHSTHSHNPRHKRGVPHSPQSSQSLDPFIITYTIILLYIFIATLHYVACFPPVLGVLGRYIILYIIYIYMIITIIIITIYTQNAYTFIYIHIYVILF